MPFLDKNGVIRLVSDLKTKIESRFQEKLVSGRTIKTINGTTLLGSGSVNISVPYASTSTPLMDGTASAGTGTAYARGDHRHPTDTSRQETLVSGSNIKTVNGNSLLGSGNVVVGGFSPTLLWTNPSPTATFAAQTVTVDLSAYEWAMIEFKATRDTDYVDVQIFKVGSAGRLQAIASGMSRRVYESSTSDIVFNAGYNLAANGSSFATSNTVCVPYKIYGL